MFGLFKKKSQDNGSAPKAKKSGGYFLELDETGNVKSDAAAPAAAPAAPAAPAAKAPAAPAAPAATAPAAPAAPAAATATVAATAKTPKAKTKTSVKKAGAKVAPAPTVAVSNPRIEPQPGLTFAPNNLLPLTTNNSRRLPGPSMNGFMEMASQMKTAGK